MSNNKSEKTNTMQTKACLKTEQNAEKESSKSNLKSTTVDECNLSKVAGDLGEAKTGIVKTKCAGEQEKSDGKCSDNSKCKSNSECREDSKCESDSKCNDDSKVCCAIGLDCASEQTVQNKKTETAKKIKFTKTTKHLALTALFTALIIVGAFIKIPIPVVPFTMQVMFVNLAFLILGKRYGTLSVAVYILMGLIGLPVFARGGGIAYVLQPTFGYLVGFLVGVYCAGLIVEKSKKKGYGALSLASAVNLIIIYAFGMIYYFLIAKFYLNNPIGIWPLFLYCFLLTIGGDIATVAISIILSKRLNKILNNTLPSGFSRVKKS